MLLIWTKFHDDSIIQAKMLSTGAFLFLVFPIEIYIKKETAVILIDCIDQ